MISTKGFWALACLLISFLQFSLMRHSSTIVRQIILFFSDKEWHDYIKYSSMRNINIPRVFGIPTPMKYQRLCATLRDNWESIKNHFHIQTDNQEYRISRIHLRKLHGKKEIFEMNYKNWRVL